MLGPPLAGHPELGEPWTHPSRPSHAGRRCGVTCTPSSCRARGGPACPSLHRRRARGAGPASSRRPWCRIKRALPRSGWSRRRWWRPRGPRSALRRRWAGAARSGSGDDRRFPSVPATMDRRPGDSVTTDRSWRRFLRVQASGSSRCRSPRDAPLRQISAVSAGKPWRRPPRPSADRWDRDYRPHRNRYY